MNSLARLRYLIATALTLTTGVIYAQSSPAAAHSAEGPAVTESVQACIEKVRPHPPETRRPCHIRGHALLAAGIIGRGGSFFVHDGTGGVFVRHRAPLDVSRGDLVEVRGEIYFDQDTELEIRASEVVRLGPGRELEPRDLTPAEVLSGEHNGELVRIRAVVTNTSISKNLVVVRLGDERLRTYWVPDRGAADLARIPTIELGAVVEVRGIARPRQREDGRIQHQVRIRTPADLSIIASAPLVSAANLRAGLLVLFFLALGGSAWIVMLRRTVRTRTAQVRELLESLESKVVELEQLNENLRGAKEKAETADRVKSEFLANISHEIRSPLTVIMGMPDLVLNKDYIHAEDRELLQMVANASEALTHIMDDLLDLSRIDAGRIKLNKVLFDARGLVREIVEFSRPKVHAKGLTLALDVDDGIPTDVYGDPTRLRQILLNLLDNAVKFTEQGGITVSLEDGGTSEGTIELCCTVSDTGIGIPDDRLEAIFKPFEQVDSSSTRPFGGAGLGLAICQKLARLMGGEISVHSRPGEGSRFQCRTVFALTHIHDADAGGTEMQASAANGKPAQTVSLRPVTRADSLAESPHDIRVLVVDDLSEIRNLVGTLLERKGYRPIFANNGREAVEVFRTDRPDLILMDIQMPGMGGVEATQEIRRLESGGEERTPIIALTAHAVKGDRESYLRSGMDDYVSKPIRSEKLFGAIAAAVNAGVAGHAEGRTP